MRLAAARILAVGLLAAAAGVAQAYCPSYTPAVAPSCKYDPAPGHNPTVAEWQGIFDLVSRGPAAWGSQGPSVPDIHQGCGKPMPVVSIPARYPCELLKAIARQESGWQQFCVPSTPASEVGKPERTIVAFDCGYGVGQVTSGMRVADPTPSFDPLRVASDATYNLATGTRILADKWRATQCVGDNQPQLIEDWYTAAWAYNGLAYSNNPTNPTYSGARAVWNPSAGTPAPYQEKVWGWIEKPPAGSAIAVAVAYPRLSEVGGTGAPPALSEPVCAGPTDCTGRRGTHVSVCLGGGAPDAGVDGATADAQDGTTDAASAGDGGKGGGSSGCGCRSGGAGGSAVPISLLVFALALGLVRGRGLRRGRD